MQSTRVPARRSRSTCRRGSTKGAQYRLLAEWRRLLQQRRAAVGNGKGLAAKPGGRLHADCGEELAFT
jgi:hypothetical protein